MTLYCSYSTHRLLPFKPNFAYSTDLSKAHTWSPFFQSLLSKTKHTDMSIPTKRSPYAHQQTHFVAIPGTFHLYKTGHGTLHIFDTDNHTRLYDIKTHSYFSPDISLYWPAATAAVPYNPTLCGSAKFHDWSFTIDLQIAGDRPIPFKAPGFFSSSRTFASCIRELKWTKDMKLLNAREELLATFTHVGAASNWGSFQTASQVAEGG